MRETRTLDMLEQWSRRFILAAGASAIGAFISGSTVWQWTAEQATRSLSALAAWSLGTTLCGASAAFITACVLFKRITKNRLDESSGEIAELRKRPIQEQTEETLIEKNAEVLKFENSATQATSIDSLLPSEKKLILRLYDEMQICVGMENLGVTQSLRDEEIAFRTNAPESDIISQCDIRITNERKRFRMRRTGEPRGVKERTG